jgi:hypothetical protein
MLLIKVEYHYKQFVLKGDSRKLEQLKKDKSVRVLQVENLFGEL